MVRYKVYNKNGRKKRKYLQIGRERERKTTKNNEKKERRRKMFTWKITNVWEAFRQSTKDMRVADPDFFCGFCWRVGSGFFWSVGSGTGSGSGGSDQKPVFVWMVGSVTGFCCRVGSGFFWSIGSFLEIRNQIFLECQNRNQIFLECLIQICLDSGIRIRILLVDWWMDPDPVNFYPDPQLR